ncbi:DUF2726 domain-containing protein (plasmid) [Photobacterium sp. DA100]|uniref:DUF2726 domain-containing protein n=1 Tax=Photobacterium sp. DA100 TaxID=3027472 RepID=UPI0024786209|nr:DUF2726 domain-containing protein [Photobacterium sp. DA100]WEM45794.1 DUF2726 domain-containing protein [Photobacterium sp. DA100]
MEVLVLLVVLVIVVSFFKAHKTNQNFAEHKYRPAGPLLTPAERSFYGVLVKAISNDYLIFSKVRVADVIVPVKCGTKKNWRIAFNKISSKHFDFIICDKEALNILCAIELNDSSHNTSKRIKRDAFLVDSMKTANIPLYQIDAKNSYVISEVRKQLACLNPSLIKTCPRCSSLLVERIASSTRATFVGCSSYPRCTYTESSS